MLHLANITNETVGENDTFFYGSEDRFHSGSCALQGNMNTTSLVGLCKQTKSTSQFLNTTFFL